MSDEKKAVNFIPFHGINQFMLDSFRLKVIREVLLGLSGIDKEDREEINRIVRKQVKVPGYRNSMKAPAHIKAKGVEDTFGSSSKLVAAILSGWMQINHNLAESTAAFLEGEGWEILPLDADRKKLPGFLSHWPKDSDFDSLSDKFFAKYPDSKVEQNEFLLMVVWLSTRLPMEEV